MPQKTLTPTLAVDVDSKWQDDSLALGWDVNGYGARSTDHTGTPLFLEAMTGRLDMSPQDAPVGFEVEFVARVTGGAPASQVIVTAFYDLGSAKTVTRARKRVGWVNGPGANEFIIEASNDGTTWVNAYTGAPLSADPTTGFFQWIAEKDEASFITANPYRYWRTWVVCNGGTDPAEARIGDFRLYVAGVEDAGTEMRYGHRSGSTPHNWGEGTVTTLFNDVGIGDNTTSVGGTVGTGGTVNVGLGLDGVAKGSTKALAITNSFATYTLGDTNDLFGSSWTIEQVRSGRFAATFQAALSGPEVEVDAARVIIYYAYYGGRRMPLREQVRQQIIIGREVGTNAVQTLTVTGTPTGGTFRLTFQGIETANIAYNAAAAAVQSALEAISSIGAGNIVGSGGALPGTPVVLTFAKNLAAEPLPLITVTTAAFTGGTSPAGAVATTTAGVRAVGAGATAAVRLRHTRIQPQPNPEFLSHRPAGEKLTNHHVLIKEASDGPFEGSPTYDEMGWLLQGLIARPNTATLQASVAYRHVFALDNRIRDGIATYQAEYGDQFARAHRIKGAVVNAIDIALRQDGIDLGGSIFAKAVEDGITMNPGAATVQTLTQSGSGNFRLRWKGQETSDIAASGSLAATDIQTALRALAGIASSTALTVSGSAGGPFTITFANTAGGPFLGFPQPLLESRTISGTPVVSMAMTTRGGYTDYPGVVVLPRHVEFFLTPTLASLASSKLSDAFATGFSVGNKANPVFNLDRAETSWFDYAEGTDLDVKFSLLAQAQSPAMSFLTQARSDTILFLRILATGPLIGASAFPHRLQIDCPVKISNFGPFSENQNVYAFEYELDGVQDDATNTNLVLTLDNGVANYN